MPSIGGESERRLPGGRARLHIRPPFDEQASRLDVFLAERDEERRPAAIGLGDVLSMVEQFPYADVVAHIGGVHQRWSAGSSGEQEGDEQADYRHMRIRIEIRLAFNRFLLR